jgi:osmoprotectant transport system permease protein
VNWLIANWSSVSDLFLDHVRLSVPPVLVSFVVALPLGYWASKSARARFVLFSLSGVLYTVPSIALLVVVPVIIGAAILDPNNVVVALSVYGVALMVRSSAEAFASVPESVRNAAVAVGYSPWQRFVNVELPLAGPVLLAGIRVVSVSTVSLVSVGSFIGISSLGNLFTDGFQRNFPTEILVGIGATIVLAAALDFVLATAGRLLMPWRRAAPSTARRTRKAGVRWT